MKRATREWVRKAEADWKGARRLARGKEPLYDLACFHCQQSAEKYLKSLMEELGIHIPKTHDLEKLSNLLTPHHAALRSLRRGTRFLTEFAISPRYPGENAGKRDTQAALRWAERVREACRVLLGIRVRRKRAL
jgi:HEPN domain-containing protein